MTRLLRTAATAALLVPATTAAPQARAGAGLVIQTKSGPVTVERLAALSEPWGMAFLPDGRLLVTEKPGRLRIYADGKLSEPIGGVPKVAYREQGGLLDVEVDPDFARNGLVYLSYAEAAEQQPAERARRRGSALRRLLRQGRQRAEGRRGGARPSGGQAAPRREGHLAAGAQDDRARPFRRPARLRSGRQAVHHCPATGCDSIPRRTSRPTSARSFASTPTARSRPTTRSPARRARRPTSGRSAIATRSARRSTPRSGGCGSTRWGRSTATSSTSRSRARTTAGRS